MKIVYPVVISKIDACLLATVPDLQIDTTGENLAEAIEMARDAISIWCVSQQDDLKRPLPEPSALSAVEHEKDDIVTLVDVDLDAYRRMLESRTVRKNLTIPSWLNEQAEKAGVNFSQILQKALKQELQIDESNFATR